MVPGQFDGQGQAPRSRELAAVTKANLEDAETERQILNCLSSPHVILGQLVSMRTVKGLFWLEDLGAEYLGIPAATSPSYRALARLAAQPSESLIAPILIASHTYQSLKMANGGKTFDKYKPTSDIIDYSDEDEDNYRPESPTADEDVAGQSLDPYPARGGENTPLATSRTVQGGKQPANNTGIRQDSRPAPSIFGLQVASFRLRLPLVKSG
ncbi:hypothetical protein BU15DRAFT_63810 [Melanogaster broomeanus]|nr:hypothetical protein BU15DRAFT_63810 [Melanogaster broomeanus]